MEAIISRDFATKEGKEIGKRNHWKRIQREGFLGSLWLLFCSPVGRNCSHVYNNESNLGKRTRRKRKGRRRRRKKRTE